MTPTRGAIARGEVREIRFDPSEGDEIKKVRPAVVMNVETAGRMQLHIVVPITVGNLISKVASGWCNSLQVLPTG